MTLYYCLSSFLIFYRFPWISTIKKYPHFINKPTIRLETNLNWSIQALQSDLLVLLSLLLFFTTVHAGFLNFKMISIAWFILQELYVFESAADFAVFHFCQDLFMNTPLLIPDGKLWKVVTGISSGSYLTQIIDSIINSSLSNMLLHSHGQIYRTTVKVLHLLPPIQDIHLWRSKSRFPSLRNDTEW